MDQAQQSWDITASVSPQQWLQRLRELDGEFPGEWYPPFLAIGKSMTPELMVLLEELLTNEVGKNGWFGLNVVDLLGAIGDTRAIPLMLRCLKEFDGQNLLKQRLVDGLINMGHPAIEICLEIYIQQTDEELRDSLAEVLCHASTRDRRIFDVLVDTLSRSSELGAMCLAEYGDSRALAPLSQAFDILLQRDDTSMLSNHVYTTLREAIEELGGELTGPQLAKAESADEPRRRLMAQVDTAMAQLASRSTPEELPSPDQLKRVE